MSLQRGKRIVIPLLGYAKIEGTLTVVLSGGKVEVHVSQDLKPAAPNAHALYAPRWSGKSTPVSIRCWKQKNPTVLVTEDLRPSFNYDRPKAVNRRLSAFRAGKLQDRIEFKACSLQGEGGRFPS
jgi:hypothetical protein